MKYRREIAMDERRNFIESVVARIREWCEATGNAFAAAGYPGGPEERALGEIARDCGLSEQDLVTMIAAGEHSADEMLLLMRELGLDPAKVAATDHAEFRQMQLTCTRCADKARCRQALLGDHPFDAVAGFCGNAPDLQDLLDRPDARTLGRSVRP